MNKLEHTVHIVCAQLKESIHPSRFNTVKWLLNNLLVTAQKMSIEKPCQELFDVFTIRQGPTTRIYRYKRWVVKLVDAQAETHALKDSNTFYNDFPFPDEETVSAEFSSMKFPIKNIDLRHLMVKAEMELRKYHLSESTLGQYWHIWKVIFCRSFQNGILTYDKAFLIAYTDTIKDEFVNGKILSWRYRTCLRATLILIEIAETGHYNWGRFSKNKKPCCVVDDFEIIRNKYCLFLIDQNLAERTIQRHDKVFRYMIERLALTSLEKLRILSPINIEKMMGHFASIYSKRSMSVIAPSLRNILDFLHNNGYMERQLSGMVMTASFQKDNVATYISKNDEKRLIAGLESTSRRTKAIILIAYRLGLRGSDICNLKFQDIDWKQDKIRINQKKTGRPLVLPLLAEVGNALWDYIMNERPQCPLGYPYVFIKNSAPYSRLHSVYGCCAKVLHDLNIVPVNGNSFGVHVFRYSLVHRLLEAKIPHQVVTDILGHTSKDADKPYISMEEEILKDCALDLSVIGKIEWKEEYHGK